MYNNVELFEAVKQSCENQLVCDIYARDRNNPDREFKIHAEKANDGSCQVDITIDEWIDDEWHLKENQRINILTDGAIFLEVELENVDPADYDCI